VDHDDLCCAQLCHRRDSLFTQPNERREGPIPLIIDWSTHSVTWTVVQKYIDFHKAFGVRKDLAACDRLFNMFGSDQVKGRQKYLVNLKS